MVHACIQNICIQKEYLPITQIQQCIVLFSNQQQTTRELELVTPLFSSLLDKSFILLSSGGITTFPTHVFSNDLINADKVFTVYPSELLRRVVS